MKRDTDRQRKVTRQMNRAYRHYLKALKHENPSVYQSEVEMLEQYKPEYIWH